MASYVVLPPLPLVSVSACPHVVCCASGAHVGFPAPVWPHVQISFVTAPPLVSETPLSRALPAPPTPDARALPAEAAPALPPGGPHLTVRIVLHGRSRRGLWTRVADAPFGPALPDPAALRAAVARAARLHFPPEGGGDAEPRLALRLWALAAGAPLRMLPADAGGGALAASPDVHAAVAVRPEASGGDDDDAATVAAREAAAVRAVLEDARDAGRGLFLLVDMDGDDSADGPGHAGRTISPP